MTADKGLAPIYSLAVQGDGLWCLSGLSTGQIHMQSIRVEEGRTVAKLNGHSGVVSVLQLSSEERSCLSGGWDKTVIDWDLETGQQRRTMLVGHDVTGQISAISIRPTSQVAWDELKGDVANLNATEQTTERKAGGNSIGLSPGSSNSFDPLFDDVEDDDGDATPDLSAALGAHSNDDKVQTASAATVDGQSATTQSPDDILLCACIDGAISIWDRRQARQALRIPLSRGTPPWCMSACWSVDGTGVFAGRRNGSMEAYDLRGTVDEPMKTIKMPHNSGPVSLVQAMPNGRSLLW